MEPVSNSFQSFAEEEQFVVEATINLWDNQNHTFNYVRKGLKKNFPGMAKTKNICDNVSAILLKRYMFGLGLMQKYNFIYGTSFEQFLEFC